MGPAWRAWYEDGSVYASATHTWQGLPAEGIIGVVAYLSETVTPYRQILDGCDWYYLEGEQIKGVENHPEWGQWAEPPWVPCLPCLKKSGAVGDRAWAAVQRDMRAATVAP